MQIEFDSTIGDEAWDVQNDESDKNQITSFAPPATAAPKSRLKALKPLKIQDPQWYRKARFKQVFTVRRLFTKL